MAGRLVVIGGGAAGMMAAGRAAEVLRAGASNAEVLLLEKMPRLGLKLRITGKGRCNITNDCDIKEFLDHLGPSGALMRNAAARFFVRETIAFFHLHGVPTVVERGQRVFPASDDANDVAEALYRYGASGDVHVHRRTRVETLRMQDGRWLVGADGETVVADAVILATGGRSYPRTGSTGDGYAFAEGLGHTIVPLQPGLVPLVSSETWIARVEGLSLRNVRATLLQGTHAIASEFGEMVFTNDGVSGPVILTLSSRLGCALERGPVRLSIDLKPALTDEVLDARLVRDLTSMGRSRYRRLLKGLLPSSLIEVFAERTGIPMHAPLAQMTAAQRASVRNLLKDFDLTITGTRPMAEAIVTLGGVACDELVPQTMASRLHGGLFFAGEVIDVAGDTGGYNLQIAFSTGHCAGQGAAEYLLSGAAASAQAPR